jgi:hypothetical protein
MAWIRAYYSYSRHLSLEYINGARRRVTVEPKELGDVAAD